jgi:hypothetical protein
MATRLLKLSLNALIPVLKLMLTTRSRRKTQRGSGYGFFMFGPASKNVAAINALLRSEDRPQVTGHSFVFGGGGGRQRGRLRIGGEGEGGGEAVIDGERRTAFGHGNGGPTLSYELVRLGGLRIYPIVGFGGAGGGVMSSELSAPKTGTALGGGGPLFFAGLHIEITIGKFGNLGHLVAGVRAGYRARTMNTLQRTVLHDGQAVETSTINMSQSQSAGTFFRFIVGHRG